MVHPVASSAVASDLDPLEQHLVDALRALPAATDGPPAAQEAEIYRLVAQNGRPQIEGGKLDVQRDEPLRAELADFVGAVRDRREPGVSGRAGREALALATKVAEAMEASAV